MSARRVVRPLAIVVLAASLVSSRRVDAYDPLAWYTIDGGGAMRSTGGGYGLSGTIGQHDAGTLAGGNYTLRGGFWRGGAGPALDAPPSGETPLTFQFRTPVPNPSRTLSRLSFDLPTAAEVRLRVYDISGRVVRQVAFGRVPAGRHNRAWNNVDDSGRRLPDGVYFLHFEAGDRQARRRMVVLR